MTPYIPRKAIYLTGLLLLILIQACRTDEPPVAPPPPPVRVEPDTLVEVSASEKETTPPVPLPITTEEQWDSLQNLTFDSLPQQYRRRSGTRIFGWHPYFYGSAYNAYNLHLMWGIAYFGYMVDPATGSYTSIHQWKTTKLVQKAHKAGCKVFLTVVSIGKEQNDSLLDNPMAQRTLADSLIKLVKLRKADGVNFDFEEVNTARKKEFNQMVVYLTKRLKKANRWWNVSLCLYSVDWGKLFDIALLRKHIDLFTIMGYDYYYRGSPMAGPVSPLRSGKTWTPYNLEKSVQYYINQGLKKHRIILGLPYYGAEWAVKKQTLPAPVDKFKGHRAYRIMRKRLDTLNAVGYLDEVSQSRYFLFELDSTPRQIWMEDAVSLAGKYNWICQQRLGGVAIWALGYDNGYTDLWNLLGKKFGKAPPKKKRKK